MFLFLIAGLSLQSPAQYFQRAAGFRIGSFYGVTYKTVLNQQNAVLEGILATRRSGISLTGMYQIYVPALDVDRLYWFYGSGVHVNLQQTPREGWVWSSGWKNQGRRGWWEKGSQLVLGADMIIGIEYSTVGLPLNLGLDWKPALQIFGAEGLWLDQVAFSMRFVF